MSRAGESREEPLIYGPKMLALQDMQRRFVEALFTVEVERGQSRIGVAAKLAGYACKSDFSYQVSGNALIRRPDVQAAIAEHYAGMTKTLGPKI
jgi:phage terminase small subunit